MISRRGRGIRGTLENAIFRYYYKPGTRQADVAQMQADLPFRARWAYNTPTVGCATRMTGVLSAATCVAKQQCRGNRALTTYLAFVFLYNRQKQTGIAEFKF